MTQHHITGSEAFNDSPVVVVREFLPRRRPHALWGWAVTGWAVAIVSIDLHLGMPLCLVVSLALLALLYFWPRA